MSRFVHPQANSAFSAIFGEPRIKKHLCTLHRHEEGTYGHSLAVAALSLDLGARNGISKDARYLTLGAGASLHDIGKLLVSSAILKSKGELTPEQRAEMDNHPCYGVKLVNGTRFLLGIDPEGVKAIIGGHHELQRGPYPRRELRENSWLDLVQIVAAADMACALSETRPYRRALSLREIEQHMFDMYTGDPTYVGQTIEVLDARKRL